MYLTSYIKYSWLSIKCVGVWSAVVHSDPRFIEAGLGERHEGCYTLIVNYQSTLGQKVSLGKCVLPVKLT